MKIAFGSCWHYKEYPTTPVWDLMTDENPDGLILLGDTIYMDYWDPRPHVKDRLYQSRHHLLSVSEVSTNSREA